VLADTALVGVLFLMLLRRFRAAAIFLLIVLITPMLSSGAKQLIERDRPETAARMEVSGYSFPSGHSLGIAATYGTMALILARNSTRTMRRCLYLMVAALVIGAVGVSRVYLGVHYPSDVLGGWSAGLALAFVGLWLETRGVELVRGENG
jgi:undecaprenyl-diphosphatase